MLAASIITKAHLPTRTQKLDFPANWLPVLMLAGFMSLAGSACAQLKPDGPPFSLEYIDAYLMQPEAFPSTGTISASYIGNGVWWRPELDETSVTVMLHNLNEWGINNIFVDVFRSGHTLFPSEVLPQHAHARGRDWLKYIITEAHNHNIRVHAWAQVLRWHEPDADAATTHPLLTVNPHWQQLTMDGQAADGATAARFVNPALPEVRAVLTSMTEELCRYPLDGLNLDAVQYNHRIDAGYNQTAIEQFQAEHGINPADITRNRAPDSDWMQWVSYREDQLTSLVQLMTEQCRIACQQNGRRILVSANVHPAYEDTRGTNRRYQHWGQWVEQAIVDATIPQCFNPDLPGLERQLWEARSVHMGSRVACLPGLLLGSDSVGVRPPLQEQRRLLANTGFQFCIIMDYQALLRKKTRPSTAPDEEDNGGFWGFLTRD